MYVFHQPAFSKTTEYKNAFVLCSPFRYGKTSAIPFLISSLYIICIILNYRSSSTIKWSYVCFSFVSFETDLSKSSTSCMLSQSSRSHPSHSASNGYGTVGGLSVRWFFNYGFPVLFLVKLPSNLTVQVSTLYFCPFSFWSSSHRPSFPLRCCLSSRYPSSCSRSLVPSSFGQTVRLLGRIIPMPYVAMLSTISS